MPHLIYIPFVFALGACIGSFLNVVVYRLPRGESLVHPPSRCPKCGSKLAWHDNVPVLGWLMLRGKCRTCRQPISPRYPIVEAATGAIFALYYVMLFVAHAGPALPPASATEAFSGWFVGQLTSLPDDWPLYFLWMFALSALLAATLIDAELFIIPAGIAWWMAAVGIGVHAAIDRPTMPGNLLGNPTELALAGGAGVGLLLSIVLLHLKVMPMSFAEGGPLLEVEKEQLARERADERAAAAGRAEGGPAARAAAVHDGDVPPEADDDDLPDFTPAQIRVEMAKELLFLAPPLLLGLGSMWLGAHVAAVGAFWSAAANHTWASGALGALLGGLVGGLVVWVVRILGSVGFGKEAMGLGDVHLMFGVGAVVGGAAATLAFFLAPFCGIAVAVYLLLTGTRRQLPYGPYLSLATAIVMLFGEPIARLIAARPALLGVAAWLAQSVGW